MGNAIRLYVTIKLIQDGASRELRLLSQQLTFVHLTLLKLMTMEDGVIHHWNILTWLNQLGKRSVFIKAVLYLSCIKGTQSNAFAIPTKKKLIN